jgi:hypothetical protein
VRLFLGWFGGTNPTPAQPAYPTNTPGTEIGHFLVTQVQFNVTFVLQIPNAGEGDDLWLYGFVDYSDEFGKHHRGGYARIYRADIEDRDIPERDRNNLAFVTKAGWNYDHTREPDEGDQSD